jgi:hypothetical protein
VTGADRAIMWSAVGAVAGVAGVAAVVSYRHAFTVVSSHGETGIVAALYPLTVDGLIYAASMALLNAARRGLPSPPLARWLLGVGIVATLAANVDAGIAYGPLGAVVAAWPAAALVGSYELLMTIIRTGVVGPAAPPVPSDVDEAVRLAHRASVAAGAPMSQRALANRFGLSRRRVGQLVTEAASPNGDGSVQ